MREIVKLFRKAEELPQKTGAGTIFNFFFFPLHFYLIQRTSPLAFYNQ